MPRVQATPQIPMDPPPRSQPVGLSEDSVEDSSLSFLWYSLLIPGKRELPFVMRRGLGSPFNCWTFSRFFFCSSFVDIKMFSVETGQPVRTLSGHTKPVTSALINPKNPLQVCWRQSFKVADPTLISCICIVFLLSPFPADLCLNGWNYQDLGL